MFYITYIRSELLRRKARTIVTVLGLAIAVALVIVIASLSRGLDHAQKSALDPLSSIGTDLTVTLSPNQPDQSSQFGGGGFSRGGFSQRGGPGGNAGQTLQANQSALTDLSKLGKPGAHFDHTFLLPGTQLTFPQSQAAQIATVSGVEEVSSGLVLSAVHQTGTVPKIVAKFKTGGQSFTVRGQVPRFTAAQRAAMRTCFERLQQQSGSSSNSNNRGGSLGGGQSRGGFGGGGFDGSNFNAGTASKCVPGGAQSFTRRFTTPQQEIQQVVNPPQTNITSTSYTIAGVDPSQPDIGLVTPSQISKGAYLGAASTDDALVADSYAAQNKLAVGSTIAVNGTTFTVVGLVKPPLAGQAADVYVPLTTLQKLSGQTGVSNVVLVRTTGSSSVSPVQKAIQAKYPNAQVASSQQVADQITGSLVDASNLSHRLGVALAILAAIAAFTLAALLTLSSVGKRVRELGTLKAIGWTQAKVVRQVVGESLAQGVLGGILGVVLGIVAAAAIGAFGPTLTATSPGSGASGAAQDAFGFGSLAAQTVSDQISLTAPIAVTVVVLGFAVAIIGGLLAGAAGAFRAARLRPADAMRTAE